MNKVNLIGGLTHDPEVKNTASGTAVARYSLAVERRYKKDEEQTADFIRCVCFGNVAEFAGKYLSKGMKIAISGRIQTGNYTNDEGQKVYTTDVIVEEHYFCESKVGNGSTAQTTPPEFDTSFADYVPDDDDGDLPF